MKLGKKGGLLSCPVVFVFINVTQTIYMYVCTVILYNFYYSNIIMFLS